MQFQRNIYKVGNSLGLTIPEKIVEKLGLVEDKGYTFRILLDLKEILEKMLTYWENKDHVKLFFYDERTPLVGKFIEVRTQVFTFKTTDQIYMLPLEIIESIKLTEAK